jgi:hypothetical protein
MTSAVAGVQLDNNTAGGLERASATTFSEPGVCQRIFPKIARYLGI